MLRLFLSGSLCIICGKVYNFSQTYRWNVNYFSGLGLHEWRLEWLGQSGRMFNSKSNSKGTGVTLDATQLAPLCKKHRPGMTFNTALSISEPAINCRVNLFNMVTWDWNPLRDSHCPRILFEGTFHRSQCRHHAVWPFHPHQHLCGPHSHPQAKRNALGISQSIVSKRTAPPAPLSRDRTDISTGSFSDWWGELEIR